MFTAGHQLLIACLHILMLHFVNLSSITNLQTKSFGKQLMEYFIIESYHKMREKHDK